MTIFAWEDYDANTRFDCEVAVVGTGAGGASAGTIVAEAGHDVLFAEEGAWHPTSSFSPYLSETIARLTRDGNSTMINGKPSIYYLEGRCVGGSTVLNGGMAWRAPERVLAGWEKTTGDSSLGPEGMERLFTTVERRIRVGTQISASVGDDNRIMAQGARKLGWRYDLNPRNQDNCVGTNNCVLGCPTGAKQSALVSWMPAAMAAGARVLTQLRVERLLIENGRCVGFVGRGIDPRTNRPDRPVTVRAKAVIVAGGAVQTPYLLLQHGVGRPSRMLGKNFYCHPNVKVLALYPFAVKGWQGVSQWGQIREFQDDGILLGYNFLPPGILATLLPFIGTQSWEVMSRFDQMIVSGVLVEDSTSGEVTRPRFGTIPRANYRLTPLDLRRFLKGVKKLAELHFTMGADRIFLPFSSMPEARSMDDLKRIDEKSCPITSMDMFTVHLMGTARLGAHAETSVVDLSGQLWDLPGCYVSDASLFPTPIGVNPQVTITALGVRVGERVAAALGGAAGGTAGVTSMSSPGQSRRTAPA